VSRGVNKRGGRKPTGQWKEMEKPGGKEGSGELPSKGPLPLNKDKDKPQNGQKNPRPGKKKHKKVEPP